MSQAVNYTPDQESKMVEAYTQASTDAERKEVVNQLADELGKKARSIVAKLSSLKVYVSPTAVTKSGNPVIRKEAIVASIAEKLELDFEDMKSLGKATKASLEILDKAV